MRESREILETLSAILLFALADISTRPYRNWGLVALNFTDGWSNYNGLETAFTKRFSQRWQLSATYTLSSLKDATGTTSLPANVVPDLGGQYSLASAISAIERSSMTMNGRERTDGRPDEIVPTAAGVVTC